MYQLKSGRKLLHLVHGSSRVILSYCSVLFDCVKDTLLIR